MDYKQYNFLVSEARQMMSHPPDALHNLSHVEGVEKYAFKIRDKLNDKADVDKRVLSVACLWHDISYSKYGFNLIQYLFETKRSIRIFNEYAQKVNLQDSERELIADAIFLHGIPPKIFFLKKKSIYYKILQDADAIEGISGNLKARHNKGKRDKSFLMNALEKALLPIDIKLGPAIVRATLCLKESKEVFDIAMKS